MEPKAFSVRLFPVIPWVCALFFAFLPASAYAGTFRLDASVDRTELDLGDTLQFTLTLTVDGSLTFQPNLYTPTFDGFDAQGPAQSYSSNWINGASTLVYTMVWQLEAKKPGRFVLGPYRVSDNDALNGHIERVTRPIVITVRHPTGLGFPMPSTASSAQQASEPGPDAASLHGIKPDRGIPWTLMAEVFAALLALLALLAWVAQRNPLKVVEEPLPADPAQAAIARLDKALRVFLAGADGRAYAVGVGEALRQYLRQRLDMRPGLTLGEAMQALRLRAPHVQPGRVGLLRQRLELLLYGGSEFRPGDQEQLDLDARGLIRGLEAARKLSPAQQALSKSLERMAKLWQEGQAKGAWMGMRSAVVEHLRKSLTLGPGPLPKMALERALRTLDAPELLRTLSGLLAEQPPRGTPSGPLVERLLRLVQVLDSMDQGLIHGGGPDDSDHNFSTDHEGEA